MASGSRTRVTLALGVTQTLAWGSSYYLPAVFADPVSAELDLPASWFYAAVSAAFLLSGMLGPLSGRLIDRHGGREILGLTSGVFAAGLLLLAIANGPLSLGLAWVVIGMAMGCGLYEAAFATVTRLYGSGARSAITGITLLGGFASTVGWPLSAGLIDAFGWRGACVAWALLHVLIGLPLNLFFVPKSQVSAIPAETSMSGTPSPPGQLRMMIILAAVFGAGWFVSTAWAAHLPRLLIALGATPAAAVFAGVFLGPAQVAARALEFTLMQKASPMISARLAVGLHPVAVALLLLVGAPAAIPFVLLHGGGNGLLTIARGTLPLALFGPGGYGFRTGLLAMPARILQGVAPLLFGFVIDHGGPQAAVALTGVVMLLATAALMLLRPRAG